MQITLDLTDREVQYLRNAVTDLGIRDNECVSLQLKVANAILDAAYPLGVLPETGNVLLKACEEVRDNRHLTKPVSHERKY
jgi:hypothetical protein